MLSRLRGSLPKIPSPRDSPKIPEATPPRRIAAGGPARSVVLDTWFGSGQGALSRESHMVFSANEFAPDSASRLRFSRFLPPLRASGGRLWVFQDVPQPAEMASLASRGERPHPKFGRGEPHLRIYGSRSPQPPEGRRTIQAKARTRTELLRRGITGHWLVSKKTGIDPPKKKRRRRKTLVSLGHPFGFPINPPQKKGSNSKKRRSNRSGFKNPGVVDLPKREAAGFKSTFGVVNKRNRQPGAPSGSPHARPPFQGARCSRRSRRLGSM